MKKYIKYKDFLPSHYVDKNISKNKKNNKKAIWMLVILNFYMLPMNIKSIFQENNSKEVANDTYYDESEKECNAFLLQYLKENKEHFMKES